MDHELKLIETMLWEDGTIFLEELHLERLAKSAKHFSIAWDMQKCKADLHHIAADIPAGEKRKIRLLLSVNGQWDISVGDRTPIPAQPVKICISKKRTDRDDSFLLHKTTHRELYDTELDSCREKGFFEVIFLNNKDQVTEGAISNVIIERAGSYYTPPLGCGVLPGVYRQDLFNSGRIALSEKILYLKDLKSADKIFITNSVMKMVEATLEQSA